MIIKYADETHLRYIMSITNHFILNSNFNLNFQAKTIDDMSNWFYEHKDKDLPIIVCIINNEVVGWASLSPFRDYRGYDKTTEVSLYVKDGYGGKGIGSKLLDKIHREAKILGFCSIVSVITDGNEPSINIHKKFGYELKAKFENIAYKNDTFLNVIFLYKIL